MKYRNALGIESLKKLTTKRLLAYKKGLLKCHETKNWEVEYMIPLSNCELTKDSPLWQNLYNNVKEILATRENIE